MARNVIDSLLISLGVVVDPKSKGAAKDLVTSLDKIKSSAAKAKAATAALGASMRELGLIAAATKAAVSGLFTGLAANTLLVAEDAKLIERQAKLLGLTAEQYQTLRGVTQAYGVDQRDLTDAMAQFAGKLGEARDGNQATIDTFQQLGISMEEIRAATPNDMLELLAEAAERTAGSIDGISAVSKVLGEEAFKQLGPLLVQGRQNLERLRKAYLETGAVLTTEQLDKYEQLSSLWKELKMRMNTLRIVIATAFLPALTKILERLRGFLDRNADLIRSGLERWVKKIGEWYDWLAERVERVDKFVRRTVGWTRILELIRNAVIGVASAFLLFKVGGAVYNGLVAINSLIGVMAAALGIGMAPAAAALAAIAALIFYVGTALAATLIVAEDFNEFMWGTKKSLLGAFVDTWKQVQGPIGFLARSLDGLREFGANNVRIFNALGDILNNVFVIGLNAVNSAIEDLMNSDAGRFLVQFGQDAARNLEPLLGILTHIEVTIRSIMLSLQGGFADRLEGFAGLTAAYAGGAPAPVPAAAIAPAPMASAARAPFAPVTNSITTTNSIAVSGGDPIANARAVRDILQRDQRIAMAKARGGAR